MDVVTGTIERVTYYNAENGYSVLKVYPDKRMPQYSSRDGLVTVVGIMPEMGAGEAAQFTGEWQNNQRYGMQMRVESVTPILPTSEQGITRYLSSGIVKGIGPRTAEKIVDHFGTRTLEILNREPQRIHEVPGLKTSLADKLIEAWEENASIRQTMIFLQGYGVSSKMATRIHAYYGAETIRMVQENPYNIADDIFGIGFRKADQIALNMGVTLDSPERIRSGLLYTLKQLTSDGHTFAPRDVLIDSACELLQIDDPERVRGAIDVQIAGRQLIADQVRLRGEIFDAIYLPTYYRAEHDAKNSLLFNIDTESRITEAAKEIDWEPFLAELARKNSVELTAQQQSAVKAALTDKVSILTGGPGTGKTTTLQMVIAALDKLGFKVALASPTGRAAKRLSEATGREAFTIHRLLGYNAQGGFEHDEDNPLDIDMLIVDEASMIDIVLFKHMVVALNIETHLMLVGDIDQLPSVGPGNVLHDVIDSEIAYVTRLQTIFRQSEDSHIIVNAHRINKGQIPFMDNRSNDFYFFNEADPARAADLVVDIVLNRVPEKFGYNSMNDVQVIAPMYRGVCGIDTLNQRLQQALNSSERLAKHEQGGRVFRRGDKVMHTRNDYEKEVFNGDIGRVFAINKEETSLEVAYESRIVLYDFSELDTLMHAYCISTHRSQGSEYPVVVMPVLTQQYMMLQRNLLYTAITRAKEMVVLVGNKQAVALAVKNNKVSQRYSGLWHWLWPENL